MHPRCLKYSLHFHCHVLTCAAAHLMQAITENVFDAVRQVLPSSPPLTLQASMINLEGGGREPQNPFMKPYENL